MCIFTNISVLVWVNKFRTCLVQGQKISNITIYCCVLPQNSNDECCHMQCKSKLTFVYLEINYYMFIS